MAIEPRPGFDWLRVNWGAPDETAAETCSYCDAEIPDEAVPFMLFSDDGWCARFCDDCSADWFGLRQA